MRRSKSQLLLDTITFPLRAPVLIEKDFGIFSSLQSERFDYVAREVRGYCLDIGCGRGNRFITQYLNGQGLGIDVFKYSGLTKKNIVSDMTNLPYKAGSFETVTLIANINHIPASLRKAELKEFFRVTKKGGLIIVTMGNPLAEVIIHKILWFYDTFLKLHVDVDSERGMKEDEAYYLTDAEIVGLLKRAGYKTPVKKYFFTQWGLNHLFVAQKP